MTTTDWTRSSAGSGQRAAVILWTDDTPSAYERIQTAGAQLGRLVIAWVTDPDGHLIQIVQDAPRTGSVGWTP